MNIILNLTSFVVLLLTLGIIDPQNACAEEVQDDESFSETAEDGSGVAAPEEQEVALTEVDATDEESDVNGHSNEKDFLSKSVALGIGAGVYIPNIMNEMMPHLSAKIEATLLLPVLDRRLGVMFEAGYSPPWHEEEGLADVRIGDENQEWNYSMYTHEAMISLGLLYRIFPPGSKIVVPYFGLLGRLYLLYTTVEGAGGEEAFGENIENSTRVGFSAFVGGEVNLGPGALLFEMIFGFSTLPHRITGDTYTGALAFNLGYRLFL